MFLVDSDGKIWQLTVTQIRNTKISVTVSLSGRLPSEGKLP